MGKTERKTKAENTFEDKTKPLVLAENPTWLIGIDEVGRGPLAGPVAVCACAIPYRGNPRESYKYFLSEYKKEIRKRKLVNLKGKDSKKLSAIQRKKWHTLLKKTHAKFAYGTASAEEIDSLGIAVCIRNLIEKNLTTLSLHERDVVILLDGALKAPARFARQSTIIKGDEKEMVISFASIFAKVTRDTHMRLEAKKGKHSVYKFHLNKGYGTPKHIHAIVKFGLSSLHRRSFCTRIVANMKAS